MENINESAVTRQNALLDQAAGIAATNDNNRREVTTELGQNDFLELLTVQLQNQDPLNPVSDTDFIASMSSFSSVEAIADLSDNFAQFMGDNAEVTQATLETLTKLSESLAGNEGLQQELTAQSYLGKQVTLQDPNSKLANPKQLVGVVDKVEIIEKENLDGEKERFIGLHVDGEIYPTDWVTGVQLNEPNGITGGFSSVLNATSNLVTNLIK